MVVRPHAPPLTVAEYKNLPESGPRYQLIKGIHENQLINFAFASITILLIAGCASMTTAPSAPPSATVGIREWEAAYYGSAAAGKGTLYYQLVTIILMKSAL